MHTGINFENKLDKESVECLSAAIVKVLETASDKRIDGRTTRKALRVLEKHAHLNATVMNCVVGDKS